MMIMSNIIVTIVLPLTKTTILSQRLPLCRKDNRTSLWTLIGQLNTIVLAFSRCCFVRKVLLFFTC